MHNSFYYDGQEAKMEINNLRDDEEMVDDTFFKSARGLLIFGKLIGLLPYKGIFSKSSANLKFRWLSAHSIISYAIILVLIFNTILELLLSTTRSRKNAYEIAQSIRITFYYIWGTVIYLNFIFRANSFLKIFTAWRACFVFFTKPDTCLKRDIILISVVILVSATLENFVLYADYVVDLIVPKNATMDTTLKSYYSDWHHAWDRYIPYHPIITVIAYLQHKCVLFCWNYMDILIAVLGRAIYFKFKSLCESAHENLVKPLRERSLFTGNPKALQMHGKHLLYELGWAQMAKDHRAICDMMKSFQEFLSPLIFVSYAVNIYYICMQLLEGLTTADRPNDTWIDILYRPWSFIHLIMRIYIVSICCARINVYAHKIRDVIQDCPPGCYDSYISRLDKSVSGGHEIGLSGLGCFTVTKPFILSVIGVMFTFEIVLLQVSPSMQQQNVQYNCTCK